MPTIEDLQQEIINFKDSTQKQVDALKLKVSELNEKKPIDRYLDNTSKDIIKDIIEKHFLDILFDNIYYYNTWFDSVDGFEAVGNSYTAAGILILETDASGSDQAYITKVNPVILNSLDFTKESRFRVAIQPRQITNQNIKAVAGDYNTQSYGFEIEDSTLKGFTHDASSGTTTDILTITANSNYTMEARFFPGNRVDFAVNGIVYGSISTTLPSDINTAEILFSISIAEQEAALKGLEIGSAEFIQSRL